MAKTRAELDHERARNRQALGLSGDRGSRRGLAATLDPFSIGSQVVSGIRVMTSFPETDYTWIPGQTAPAGDSTGNFASDWMLRHVIRPRGAIMTPAGEVAWDPYQADTDWSFLFKVGSAVVVGAAGFGVAWLLVRAFSGGR